MFKIDLKSVSKVFVNIFRNFNAISDFSFAMNSDGHKDNFQLKNIRSSLILLSKNEDDFFPF